MSRYRLGCCIPGGSFMPEGVGEVDTSTYGILKSGYEMVLKHGFDYAECTVGLIMKMTDEEFEKAAAEGLRFERCNSFIPPSLPIIKTMSEEPEKMRSYLEKAMYRMSKLGTGIVVFGSGTARRVNDGDSSKTDDFVIMCNEYAVKYNIMVALEPLNSRETDIITSVREGYEYVKSMNLSNFKLLADNYHMYLENEPIEVLSEVQDELIHVHISEPDRTHPGAAGGEYLRKFSHALQKTCYKGGITAECRFEDFIKNSAESYEFMKEVF